MKKKLLKLTLIPALSILFPVLVFAQNLPSRQTTPLSSASTCITNNQIGYLLCTIQQLLDSIVWVLIGLGVVYFVWGVVQYFIKDNEEAKKKGKERIIFSIIGFAVILSMWGLVHLVVQTLGFSPQSLNAPSLTVTTTSANSGSCAAPTDVQTFLGFATCIINNSVIPLIFAVAVVMFIWGAVNFFIINSGEEAKRAQGRQFMIWGIIALTVMLSVWGIVGLLGSSFGLKTNVLPCVKPPGQGDCR